MRPVAPELRSCLGRCCAELFGQSKGDDVQQKRKNGSALLMAFQSRQVKLNVSKEICDF